MDSAAKLTTIIKRQRAYERLGVSPSSILSVAQITPILSKYLPGGLEYALECLMASDNPEIRRMLQLYWNLGKVDRSLLPLEAFCIAAGIDPWTVMGVIQTVAGRVGTFTGGMLAAIAHPEIVKKSIEVAQTDQGEKDREYQFKHSGFLPTPAGPRTTIRVNAQANAQAASQAAVAASPEDTIRRLNDRFNAPRKLEANLSPALSAPVIDAEVISQKQLTNKASPDMDE